MSNYHKLLDAYDSILRAGDLLLDGDKEACCLLLNEAISVFQKQSYTDDLTITQSILTRILNNPSPEEIKRIVWVDIRGTVNYTGW